MTSSKGLRTFASLPSLSETMTAAGSDDSSASRAWLRLRRRRRYRQPRSSRWRRRIFALLGFVESFAAEFGVEKLGQLNESHLVSPQLSVSSRSLWPQRSLSSIDGFHWQLKTANCSLPIHRRLAFGAGFPAAMHPQPLIRILLHPAFDHRSESCGVLEHILARRCRLRLRQSLLRNEERISARFPPIA